MILFVSPNNIQPLEHFTTVWPKLNMLNCQEKRSDSKGNKATLNSNFIGTFPKFFWEFHDLQVMVTDLPRLPVSHPFFYGLPVVVSIMDDGSFIMLHPADVLLDVLGQLSTLLEGFHVLQRLQLCPLGLRQPAPGGMKKRGENTWDLPIHGGMYGYGSKNGYGSFRGDPDVWNEELSASV